MRATDKRRAEAWGRRSERLAVLALALKGYRILARRWRSPVGEVDLVARRGRTLVAVEVKARRGGDDHPVGERQWRRIANALEAFVAARPALASHDRRYDLVMVRPRRWPRHEPDAWRP